MPLARRTWLKVTYDNKDISTDLAPYLKSFALNDVFSGAADDIEIELEDRAELWKADWLPEKGALLNVSIMDANWQSAAEQAAQAEESAAEELPLGQFEIDEIEASGAPEVVKIKAVSVPNNTELRGVDRSRSWEKTKLSVIAKDIADAAKLELYYKTEDDPDYDRVEQTEQSDLSFLQKLCDDAGLALKITDLQIVIFDEAEAEKAEAALTITKGVDWLKSYSVKSSVRDIYAACHVKYRKSKKKEYIEATYRIEGKEGKVLQVNEEVKSQAEAEKLAKKKLREKNKEEITASMTLVGSFALLAGLTVNLAGFGKFDGKYIIAKAAHNIGGGYSVALDLRRCLDGY